MEKISLYKSTAETMQDLEGFRNQALDIGATGSEIIKACRVKVDERVKMKCRVPRCTYYGESANCPPFSPDVDEMKKTINKYSHAVVIKLNVPVDDFSDRKRFVTEGAKHYRKITQIVSAIELAAFHSGYYLALAFGAGCCKLHLCDGLFCQYLDSQKCRYNMQARPSMESVGIDVFDLVTAVGWDIYPIGGKTDKACDIKCASVVGIVFIC